MLVKDILITELDSMSSPELLRIYEFISAMKLTTAKSKTKRIRSTHYLKVRKALSSIRKPLSGFIISERDERI